VVRPRLVNVSAISSARKVARENSRKGIDSEQLVTCKLDSIIPKSSALHVLEVLKSI